MAAISNTTIRTSEAIEAQINQTIEEGDRVCVDLDSRVVFVQSQILPLIGELLSALRAEGASSAYTDRVEGFVGKLPFVFLNIAAIQRGMAAMRERNCTEEEIERYYTTAMATVDTVAHYELISTPSAR